MVFQRIYDWLVPVNERARESERKRNLDAYERMESLRAKRNEAISDFPQTKRTRKAFDEFYETQDGARAAEVVGRQRLEQGRKPVKDEVQLEAWEQAQLAEEDAVREEWREKFKDFDQENLDNRIGRIRSELDSLLKRREKEFDIPVEQPSEMSSELSRERDWDAINATPARGFFSPGNGRKPYLQMVELRAPEVLPRENQESKEERPAKEELSLPFELLHATAKEVPQEEKTATEVESKLAPEVNWDVVNEAAKNISTPEEATRAANLAANCEKHELSEFWQQLAKDLEQEIQEKNDDDPNE